MNDQESIEYKRKLLKLLPSILSEIVISEDEEENIDESDEVNKNVPIAFQTKLLEVKKCMNDIPTIISKFNAELGMLPNVAKPNFSNNSCWDNFVWRFHISFDWNEKNIALPIKKPEDIDILDTALTDEHIYLDVVSSDFLTDIYLKIFWPNFNFNTIT